MPGEVVLRRVVPGDWTALRALRLEMVEDTPIGFVETLDVVRGHADDEWRYRAVRGSEGGDSYHLVAVQDGALVGQAVTFPAGEGTWMVVGVYLQPGARGRGLLGRLLDGLATHAAEHGGVRQRLGVHEDNARARAAYARLGFVDTGEREPYPLGPAEELVLERDLPGTAIG